MDLLSRAGIGTRDAFRLGPNHSAEQGPAEAWAGLGRVVD